MGLRAIDRKLTDYDKSVEMEWEMIDAENTSGCQYSNNIMLYWNSAGD